MFSTVGTCRLHGVENGTSLSIHEIGFNWSKLSDDTACHGKDVTENCWSCFVYVYYYDSVYFQNNPKIVQ